LDPTMSVRYDHRPKIAPAAAGQMSFGGVARALAPTNDPRS
jgi:hypothetical protein